LRRWGSENGRSGERLWNSLAIWLVAIGLILVYAYFFGRPTMFVWQAKQESASDPKLALVPIPLSDTSISTTPGTIVTLFGYQFEVPWQGQVAVRNPGDDHLAVVYSAAVGKPLMFFNPAKNGGLVETTRAELKARGEDPRIADAYLDAHSDYDLIRSTLYTTPAQLSLIFPGKNAVYAATRLMIKRTEAVGAETGLYSFQIGQLRGFQIGDPSRARNVRVIGFDRGDNRFEFGFGGVPGHQYVSKQGFNQAEINRVLQSLRSAPSSQQ